MKEYPFGNKIIKTNMHVYSIDNDDPKDSVIVFRDGSVLHSDGAMRWNRPFLGDIVEVWKDGKRIARYEARQRRARR